MKFQGSEAGRRWRMLDLPGIVKHEQPEADGCVYYDHSMMIAEAVGGRIVAHYTRDESPAPHSQYDMIVTQELEIVCAVVAAHVETLCAAEDAAAEAREALAATLRDPEEEEFDRSWRRERAQEAGMSWGCDAYNDHMGY